VPDHEPMRRQAWWRPIGRSFAAAVVTYLAGTVLIIGATGLPSALARLGATLPALVLGVIVGVRRPSSTAAPALILLADTPLISDGVAGWGATFGTAGPWPGARRPCPAGSGSSTWWVSSCCA
jgi:hypothetical protein